MKQQRIILRDNHIGQIAFTDIQTKNGFTVIPQGGTITQNLIMALQKRNNPYLYFTLNDESPSIEYRNFKRHEEWAKFTPQSPIQNPITNSQKPNQSLNHSSVPFYTFITQLQPEKRTMNYKVTMHNFHDSMTQEVKSIFNGVLNHTTSTFGAIKSAVEKIIVIASKDKNILINLCLKNTANDYLYAHALNVCFMSMNIAIAKGFIKEDVIDIGIAALLHDIGMLYTDVDIRTHRDKLGINDTFEIKSHPTISSNILDSISELPECVHIVAMQVHERENGKGYPKGIGSNCIHRYAKIIAVADVYIAMINTRPYRKAKRPFFAIKELVRMMQSGFLERDAVKHLLNNISIFPIGSVVELSNNTLAKVINANGNSIAKPEVSIITDTKGQILKEESIIQEKLHDNSSLEIVGTRHALHGIQDIMFGF